MNDPADTRPSHASGTATTLSISEGFKKVKGFLGIRNGEASARDTLRELIEEREEAEVPIAPHERTLMANVLKVRNVSAEDVMVPRADITAVEIGVPLKEVTRIMAETGHSRLPVYRKTLDDVKGMVHIKDLLGALSRGRAKSITPFIRPTLTISPAERVMNLLMKMRQQRLHMALVCDEHGGIDGLVTIEDLVEEIVGEIEDEHDFDIDPEMTLEADGTWLADARFPIEEFEKIAGITLTEDEREETDTLGGLVSYTADRVPDRGELIKHESGIEFEVLESDPRHIRRLRLHNVAPLKSADDD